MWIFLVLLTVVVGFAAWRQSMKGAPTGPRAPAFSAPKLNVLAGLSFEDALDSEKLAAHVQRETQRALVQIGAPSDSLAIEVAGEDKRALVLTFDQGSYEFIQNAHGTYRAVAKGVFSEKDAIASWMTRFASGTAAIVTVSNIVSSADAARRLGNLLKGQDRVFAYRSIDQFAELRATYEQLREELDREQPRPETLENIRHRLRKTRHVLMAEARADLESLDDLYPERTGLFAKPRMTWDAIAKRGGTEGHSARIKALEEYRGKLLLARKCLDFERLAAASAGVNESQSVLLGEAATELATMLPRYRELEDELAEGESMAEALDQLFE